MTAAQHAKTSPIPRRLLLLKLMLTLAIAACGGQNSPAQLDEHDFDSWQQAAALEWVAEPGEQLRSCQATTVEHDLYVGAFRITAPTGTTRVQLSYADPSGPDGAVACDAAEPQQPIVVSAIADSWELPEHVALHIPAGKQLLLEISATNHSTTTLQGTSGVEIALRPATEVQELAQAVVLRPSEPTPGFGSTALASDGFLFAVQPHMGPSGQHLQITAHSSFSGDVSLYDEAYGSAESTTRLLEQHVPLRAGEPIALRCDFQPAAVTPQSTWPDAHAQPSCFVMVYHY